MKIQLSKQPIGSIALLILLLLSAFTGLAVLVNAAATKDNNVIVDGSGSGSITLKWKSGKTQTYTSSAYANLGGLNTITVVPDPASHIGSISIDGNDRTPTESACYGEFSLISVVAKNKIEVSFSKNEGKDAVETGSGVEAYPYPNVGLIFANVQGSGWAFANENPLHIYLFDAKGAIWDIQTDATFGQSVTVMLVLSLTDLPVDFDPAALRLLRTEVELARADVNSDGMVDGIDVSIVANANPSTSHPYDPRLDLNDDGKIDDLDVNIVNNYIGESVWADITMKVEVDNGFVYVYGETNHFSIFGIR